MRLWTELGQTPSTNIQAPEKVQTSSAKEKMEIQLAKAPQIRKRVAKTIGVWCFGASLELGCRYLVLWWCLVFGLWSFRRSRLLN
jgi:hypothetical protein